jgi:hypothetical protein
MSQDEERKLRKEAIKEAMREWLDEEKKATYESIGKWITHAFTVMLLGALVWFIMISEGWHK